MDSVKGRFFKSVLLYGLLALLFVYLFWFYYNRPGALAPLADLTSVQVIGLLLSSMLVFVGMGLQQRCMLRPSCKTLGNYESFQLAVSNTLLNYLPLKTGVFARGAYLKSRHKLGYTDYIIAAMAIQLLWIAMAGLLGLLAAGLLLALGSLPAGGSLLAALLLLSALFAAGLFLFGPAVGKYLPFSRLRNFFTQYSERWQHWQADRHVLRSCCLFSGLLFVLFALRLWLSFYLVGGSLGFLQLLFMQACLAVAFAFSLLPGNLGVREGALVGLAVLLGNTMETALLAALLDRAASLLPVLLLGPFYLHQLSRQAILN